MVSFLSRVAAISVLGLALGACNSSSSTMGEALQLATSATQLAATAVTLGSYRPSSSSASRASVPAISSGNGYSQAGAFEDCAKMYGMAGNAAGQQECIRRRDSMKSLH